MSDIVGFESAVHTIALIPQSSECPNMIMTSLTLVENSADSPEPILKPLPSLIAIIALACA
jgi:hypothetical protein